MMKKIIKISDIYIDKNIYKWEKNTQLMLKNIIEKK